jgi:L-malate glycosyltransferase
VAGLAEVRGISSRATRRQTSEGIVVEAGLNMNSECEVMPVRPSAMAGSAPSRPIRILYIMDSIWNVGGAEACLVRMTKHLPPGFECRVLTFHSSPKSRWFIDQFDCPVDHWQINNVWDRTAFRVARQLYRLVRDQQIDIVHTFFQTSDLWAGPIAKLAGAKVHISSRRDMGFMRQRKHHLVYRLLRGSFDQVQAVSEGVRQYTIETDGVKPERTLTVHTGIDPEVNVDPNEIRREREQYDLPEGVPVITTVANHRHVKGIDVLVRAAALVIKEAPDARFLIVGGLGGNAEDQAFSKGVVQLAESLGVGGSMRFAGESKRVPTLLALGDVFVLPSRSEGFSNALLEAMRAGLPCVATSVGGNPEVVAEGVTGYLVPPNDPEAMASRILELIRNPVTRRQMGAAGRRRMLQEFTTEIMVSKVTAAYDHLLRNKGSRSPARAEN